MRELTAYDFSYFVWENSGARRWPFADWLHQTWSFEFRPIFDGGELIAVAMIKDNEVHIASNRKPKGSARAAVRSILVPIIEQYGFAKTSVIADNAAGLAFCRRLGFVVEREEGALVHLTCKEPRHA